VSARGYARTTVTAITALAGVSRTTFYQQFRDKEALFLDCYQSASDVHRARVEHALRTTANPPEQAAKAIRAYLGLLADDPDFARAFFLEPQVATPKIRDRFLRNLDEYADIVQAWHQTARTIRPELPRVTRPIWAAVVAGIAGVITQHLKDHSPDGIVEQLTEPCLQLMLVVAGVAQPRP
jgi:AcrR family transcriptional regulator